MWLCIRHHIRIQYILVNVYFWKMCDFLDMFGSIGRSKSPSIVYLIICTFGKFTLMVLVVGRTLFMWEDTSMKFPVHPVLATTEFSSFDSCFWGGTQKRLLHTCALSIVFYILPLQFNKLYLWSYPPPFFRLFPHTHVLFTCDIPIWSHLVAYLLCPNLVRVHIADECVSLVSYPCVQQ